MRVETAAAMDAPHKPAWHFAAPDINQTPAIHAEGVFRVTLLSLPNTLTNEHINILGDTGFEPVTSCVSCMRSNQLS